MKLASVLAGATAVALALTATAASAGPAVYRGAATGTLSTPIGSITGTVKTGDSFFGFNYGTPTIQALDAANPGINSNIALFTIDSAGFSNNSGTANTSNSATFSLSGTVTPDCAYYTGGTTQSIEFGQIGINAQDNNPDAAFEMVDSQRSVDINSNLAGCNTKNTVKFTKTDLQNASAAGFDADQFTNVIPVELQAQFKAGVVGATTNASQQTVTLSAAGNVASESSYGAWKSPLDMKVTMRNPGKGLLAGSYTGTVGLTIAVAN